MKTYSFFLFIIFIYSSVLAQTNGPPPSSKTDSIKEDVSVTKKRKYTYFVSDRLSDDNKYDIFKVVPTTNPPSIIIVRGHMEALDNPSLKRAKINVYNASNNELVGIYNTNSYTGNYLLVLVPNVKYIFNVEAKGYGTMQEVVEVPSKIDYEICQQHLKIKLNDKQKPVLLLNSFFADGNEKVFYLKSFADTTNMITDNTGENEVVNNSSFKNIKQSSNIDELVKKQIEEEKKKPAEALKAYKNNDFERASTLYGELLKNDPGDPFVNYYYGISLLKLDKNKAKAINSLHIAAIYKDVPYDVHLYLGKAYHLSYLFQEAITAFDDYIKRAKPTEVVSNHVHHLIDNCKNGIVLITEQVNIDVIKRSSTQSDNILASYNSELVDNRVAYKTEFFYSVMDKKKQDKFIICNYNKREYIHASYGEKGETTHLYKNISSVNGSIGASELLPPDINTPYDENYPFITKDGKTLYFSSKGHNSMGGYDIFKCTRSDTSASWSKPQNMGYPINSTYDDILFIPDTANLFASFCSNRKNNAFEYIQIKLPDHGFTNSIIKGNFITLDSIPGKDATLTVYNVNTEELVGVYKTNPITGNYLMILPSGEKYAMTIESEGYPDMLNKFEVPEKKGEFVLKQAIIFRKDSTGKPSKVINYFTEVEAARINFNNVSQKENALEASKTKARAEHEVKKHEVIHKPVRTPEESKKDQEDLKQARDLFNHSNYQEAALLYQNIEQHIDLDAADAYNYGVSLYHAKKDKTICITMLELASVLKNTPLDVFYYLGRANYMNYRFSTAIKWYKKYITVCKPVDSKKLNIDKEIEYCTTSIKLVNNPLVLEVFEKKHVEINYIQHSFSEIESKSKILVITDDMRSSIDKKKNFKSLLFLSADKSTILYSSYGEDDANGKDIYQLKKLGNGKWSTTPLNIANINTPMDEEYPSLSKDGKILYFSSKGWENMGGYDIFKSIWNENTQTWSQPVNLGSPINSPFEDIYFLE
jgi:tetratricopeptide (TPR) repeat protein